MCGTQTIHADLENTGRLNDDYQITSYYAEHDEVQNTKLEEWEIFDNDDELINEHLFEMRNEYEDYLMDEDFADLSFEQEDQATHGKVHEKHDLMSTPIYDGASLTVGMSLFSIMSYSVRNSLR